MLNTSMAVCHWDCQPKHTKIMPFLIGFSRCANRESQSQGLLQGLAGALLICIKIDDLQGL